MYQQIEGVAMGSPLGPTFANFYMCHIENHVLQQVQIRPFTYCRYVDDTYVVVRDDQHLHSLKLAMEEASVLTFTYETSIHQKLPFLDVAVDGSNGLYTTSVYKKPTDAGRCLNAASECPTRYKTSVISAFLQRAYNISSNWKLFTKEIDRIKQTLINNGFTNTEVDRRVKHFLNNKLESTSNQDNSDRPNIHKMYYKNQMSSSYKIDERVIKSIISDNVQCVQPDDKLQLIIYYKNKKTSNFVMKNNLAPKRDDLRSTGVVYQYSCKIGDCGLQPSCYIGETVTTLSRRITGHLQEGAPKKHSQDIHDCTLTRNEMVSNTKIIHRAQDSIRLKIAESLYIRWNRPIINRQDTGYIRTLRLFAPRFMPPQES
jgi:hypothetical protein